MLFLAISLFFTEPAPLDMPRAQAYLVKESGVQRLEDRYDRLDLWVSQTVTGRWIDEAGREFMLAKLDSEPPAIGEHAAVSRAAAVGMRVPMKRLRANAEIPQAFRRAVEILSDCPLTEDKPRHSRQLPRGYRNVDYWHHPTNYTSIVCAFRQEKSEVWHLAVWRLAEGDDYSERMQAFEDEFLRKEFSVFNQSEKFEQPASKPEKRPRHPVADERELLRADAKHSIAAYANWHFSDTDEFAVIDDLPQRGFIETLTNDFSVMRTKYAAAVPTSIDGSNVLCVARIYASRTEYLEALETSGNTNMSWTAAYWCPGRRELVAYLPAKGEEELLKTIRHEAFHQYLSYASAMISTSPWLNEGYAQYFEDEESREWGERIDLTEQNLERLAAGIPGLLAMDYEKFYGGTDWERHLKYRLAWSIAVFLERGADRVRFQPFDKLKKDYFETLLRTQDMQAATHAAFRNADTLKLFVSEWKKFWKNR